MQILRLFALLSSMLLNTAAVEPAPMTTPNLPAETASAIRVHVASFADPDQAEATAETLEFRLASRDLPAEIEVVEVGDDPSLPPSFRVELPLETDASEAEALSGLLVELGYADSFVRYTSRS